MAIKISMLPKISEHTEEPVLAPCPGCGKIIETTFICRSYDHNWNPTDEIISHTRCEPCQTEVAEKVANDIADAKRNVAIAETKRAELKRQIEASEPVEHQISFDTLRD